MSLVKFLFRSVSLASTNTKRLFSFVTSSPIDPIRLNRCLPKLSRREADKTIESGRVKINKVVAKLGTRLVKGDVLELDGKIVYWEEQSTNTLKPLWQGIDNTKNVYIKLWKPTGSTCTTEPNDERNIFRKTNILQKVTKNRLFPVGRLDKHTTGLILLTSDTRLVKTLLGAGTKQEKVYQVKLHKNISDEDIQTLCEGIMITTATTTGKVITAMTLPCVVKRLDNIYADPDSDPARDRHHYYKNLQHSSIEIRLMEGRNRQIRRMVEGLGYKVLALHRTDFCQLTLSGLKEPTDWCTLSKDELDKIVNIAKVNHQIKTSHSVSNGFGVSGVYSNSDSIGDGLDVEEQEYDLEDGEEEVEESGGV